MNEQNGLYMWNVQRMLEKLEGSGHEPSILYQSETNANNFEFEGTKDVLVDCGGRAWGASRAILSQGCKVFRKMFNSQFQVGRISLKLLSSPNFLLKVDTFSPH